MQNKFIVLSLIACLIIAGTSCEKTIPGAPEDDQILDGPIEGLTPEQNRIFLNGDVAFNGDVFSAANGLGPMFVANSCGSCHAGDGKGHPFTTLTRFGQSDTLGNKFLMQGGPQLQNRAIPGYQPEKIPAGATFSNFTPPANTGLGFFEAISDATIMAMADVNDANGDGISGRPNWITIPQYSELRPGTIVRNGKYIGRFGKKAAVYDLLQQTANAYNQDMGITSTYEHFSTYKNQDIEPEISNQKVLDVVFYLKTLKAPVQRDQNNPDVISGKQVFLNISCGKCHTPQLQTEPSSIAALSNKTFAPYTDFLLHDLGPALDDKYTEGTALTPEWRTPALWGLGLSKNSQGGEYHLLHDGRAKSIEQAVLMHGGEAEQSKNKFQQLPSSEKTKLLKFLESL
ncbi:di-heme oxidoredictase family protein [Daejeonella sp.]|uniref:di-heme oxidoredictase family protein n=1 Tax=Daejeonella sp. TaxID=2805397 RepID=UPI002721BDCE|nr:di-heme oxidoredictase family protein [Daejeonella sp.]MDO8991687.1 di-heme oxidoredictase family protein [Daejeonella sp.]MDP2412471.1 di-heme oxidoredictase family protein [Daejeonella sp.]